MHVRACSVLAVVVGHTTGCGDLADDPAEPPTELSHAEVFHDRAPRAERDFTETYGTASLDAGHWALSANDLRMREIEPDGGNPGGFLYSEVSSAIPTWSTASSRVPSASDDGAIRDTIFVGDYRASDIHAIAADLRVVHAGSWSASRTVSLQLTRWDVASDAPALRATYSLPDIALVPSGWQHYVFELDASSPRIPPGWSVTRPDGTPGDAADWAFLMQQVDVVSLGYWKPGYVYPALGIWQLGIDNVHIAAR